MNVGGTGIRAADGNEDVFTGGRGKGHLRYIVVSRIDLWPRRPRPAPEERPACGEMREERKKPRKDLLRRGPIGC